MATYHQLINKFKDQRGATVILVAITVLLFLIGIMALAIDVGYLYATKNELQNIADAGALAGAGKLGEIYTGMTPAEQDSYDFEVTGRALIETAVQEVVTGDKRNIAGGKNIIIDNDNDIFINNMVEAGLKFNTNDYVLPDAVRVIARSNGPVSTFFGRIFGITGFSVNADATAGLTTLDDVGPGEMNMPIGVSENWFIPTPNCEDTIRFSPTTDSCAGWHNFFDPINASAEAEKILGFIVDDPTDHDTDPTNDPDPAEICDYSPCGNSDPGWLDVYFDIPADKMPPPLYTLNVESGESIFEFQGGTISSLFNGGTLVWGEDRVTAVMDGDHQMVDGNPKAPAPFFAIYDYFRFRDGIELPPDGLWIDADNDPLTGIEGNELHVTNPDEVWSALIPVYEDTPDCTNPNEALVIVGFAVIHVVMPNPPPDSTVTAKLDCNLTFIGGQGGGGTTGNVRGSIPNLVE